MYGCYALIRKWLSCGTVRQVQQLRPMNSLKLVSLATNRILAKTARSPLISKGDCSENVSQLSSQTKNTKSNSYCLVAFRADPIAAKVTRLAALANCPAPPVR